MGYGPKTFGKGATVRGARVTAPRLPGFTSLARKKSRKKKRRR